MIVEYTKYAKWVGGRWGQPKPVHEVSVLPGHLRLALRSFTIHITLSDEGHVSKLQQCNGWTRASVNS